MAIAETVKNFLEQKAVEYDLISHPHTGSSHETAEASYVDEDHIAKGDGKRQHRICHGGGASQLLYRDEARAQGTRPGA